MQEPLQLDEHLRPPRKRSNVGWLLGLAAVVVVAILAWRWVTAPVSRPEPVTAALPSPAGAPPVSGSVVPSVSTGLPKAGAPVTGELPPVPAALAPVRPAEPGAVARALIAELETAGDANAAATAAARAFALAGEGRTTDAYLLYFYAARGGDAEAAFKLGESSDPLNVAPADQRLRPADPVQAHKWYSRAVAAGHVQAGERLGALRRFVEQAAATGDIEAQRLVLQWR
ncbi:MAG: sel1 repeat family protein [Chromatiales bacterium]|nr:sel1 repeat family protein [Chromatiales bacterium]